jgi:hypothetical protein
MGLIDLVEKGKSPIRPELRAGWSLPQVNLSNPRVYALIHTGYPDLSTVTLAGGRPS